MISTNSNKTIILKIKPSISKETSLKKRQNKKTKEYPNAIMLLLSIFSIL